MDAADPAGREDADPRRARDGERAADRGRADRTLDGGDCEVARPGFARFRPEAGELFRRQSDAHVSVEDADRRRDGTGCAHLPLRLEPDLNALPGGKP